MTPAETAEAPPRFCPLCLRPAAPRDDLCRHCGERTAAQGYCPVCQSFRLFRIGEDCPKHDLPLEAGAIERADSHEGGERPRWTTLARFDSLAAAEGPRLRLEAEGIPTFLDGLRMATDVLSHPALGGVKLQVPATLVDEARVLLDQSWGLPPPDDLDDAWDELGPEPGARRRKVMQWAIIVILALPLLSFVIELLLG